MKKKITIFSRNILMTYFIVLFSIIIISCSDNDETINLSKSSNPSPPSGNIDQTKEYSAIFDTEVGSFEILLFSEIWG